MASVAVAAALGAALGAAPATATAQDALPRFPRHAPTPTPRAPDPATVPANRGGTAAPDDSAAAPPDVGVGSFDGVALTPAQVTHLRDLTATTRAALSAVHARQSPDVPPTPEDRAELRRVVEAHHAAVRDLLTEPQRTRFDANVTALTARHRAAVERRARARWARAHPRPTGARGGSDDSTPGLAVTGRALP